MPFDAVSASCKPWLLADPHGAAHAAQVRDPVDGVFSAETMLRNMGVPLDWSLAEPVQEGPGGEVKDARFDVSGTRCMWEGAVGDEGMLAESVGHREQEERYADDGRGMPQRGLLACMPAAMHAQLSCVRM